jgi:hypothetical protein
MPFFGSAGSLALAVGIHNQQSQVVNVFTPTTFKDEDFLGRKFGENTRNNIRVMRFKQSIGTPGKHILKISMVDPIIVAMKVIIHNAPLATSYFDPRDGQELQLTHNRTRRHRPSTGI